MYFNMEERLALTKALRKEFPDEKPIPFLQHSSAKESVEFALYIVVGGVDMRVDVEVSDKAIESHGVEFLVSSAKQIFLADVADGTAEEIIRRAGKQKTESA